MKKKLRDVTIGEMHRECKLHGSCCDCPFDVTQCVYITEEECLNEELELTDTDPKLYCRDCKWYKKIEHSGETYTVCWLPFKKNPNGVNTVSAINDDDIGCREFEEEKENEC